MRRRQEQDGIMLVMSGHHLVSEAKAGSLDRVSYLLRKGSHPDSRDGEGNTALFWACCRGHAAICRVLVFGGADVNSATMKTGTTPLMACADNNQVVCMEGLLRYRSVKVDLCNKRGDTALHMASYRGYAQVLRLLIQHKANPFIYNNSRRTALEEAKAQKETECVQLMRCYMDLFTRQKTAEAVKRKPSEVTWTMREEMGIPFIGGIPNHTNNPGASPNSIASVESADSAVVVSPPISFEGFLPNPVAPSSSSPASSSTSSSDIRKIPKGSSQTFNHPLGYNNVQSCNGTLKPIIKGQCVPDSSYKLSSMSSLSSSFDFFSADCLHQSVSSISNSNISLDSGTASTTETNGTKFNASFSESIPTNNRCGTGEITIRSASENCEKYPSRAMVNDLSSKALDLSGDVHDLLPSFNHSLNILPHKTGKTQSTSKSKLNRPSETTGSSCGEFEVISGLQMSDFIENLQMQLLQNQADLRREQRYNHDLQQQVKTLNEDNIKLTATIHSLHKAFSQRSSATMTSSNTPFDYCND